VVSKDIFGDGLIQIAATSNNLFNFSILSYHFIMSSSQDLFSTSSASNQSQNHPLIRQINGAVYELRSIAPADRTGHQTNFIRETSIEHMTALPTSSYLPSSSTGSISRQTALAPFPEAIRNTVRPIPRRRQGQQAVESAQTTPAGFTIYGGAGEAGR
jgi:hypothetical protein